MGSRSVIIDNTDAQIQYTHGWQANGSPNEYKGTTSNTAKKGSSFTVKFVGTSIAVYGTLAFESSPNSTYTLDGGDSFPFLGKRSSSVRYQQVFYSSPPLVHMEHTLVGICTDEGGSEVILDYFVIETPLDFPTNTSSPPPLICDSKPTPPTAVIVASVLGGFMLLATIFASYLWYSRYHDSASKLSDTSTQSSPIHTPPFHATNPRSTIFTANTSTRSSTVPLSDINTRNSSNSQDVLLFCLEPGPSEPQRHTHKDLPRLWLNTGI